MTPRALLLALVLASAALCPRTGMAQEVGGGEVTVELDLFGLGSAYRPGTVTPIRLLLTSRLGEPTPVWVQWEVPNAEGDIAEYGRQVTLSPGGRVPVWLYAPLPPLTQPDTVWTVRVFEEEEGRRRGELGGVRISPNVASAAAVEPHKGMIAVIGTSRMRLEGYTNTWTAPTPIGAHEDTWVISGLEPRDVPDRWEGLSAFNTIVWGDADPQQMRSDGSRALREWLRRGGHLVIVLPEAGNPWALGARGQSWMEDLLPSRPPRRDEGVPVSELLPLLTKSTRPPLRDFETSVRVFKEIGGELDLLDNRYEPLMALPDGRVVAAQRIVDFGRVTLIGIDVTSQQLVSMQLPQADRFWNRVLGRRCDTPLPAELQAMQDAEPTMLTRGSPNQIRVGDARIFKDDINKTGRAEQGLLAAFLLFVVYFLVAGPLGFFVLKQNGWVRHSWLAFALMAGLFTAVAWGGVRVLQQKNVEFNHVTVLDQVARPWETSLSSEPHYQRAVSWGSLYLPSYGTADVALESAPLQRDLLLTWSAPPNLPDPFPNVTRYLVDVGRSPAHYRIPVRATATQLYANWMGALDPGWGGTIRVDSGDPIRVEPGSPPRLSGTLINDLPGPLLDVTVIWVTGARPRDRAYEFGDDEETGARVERGWVPPAESGDMLNTGHMWKTGLWDQGASFPLDDTSLKPPPGVETRLQDNIYETYLEDESRDTLLGMPRETDFNRAKAKAYLEMLGIYHQLSPPKYLRQDNKDTPTVVAGRILGREIDLSPWFTRPCLIVTGFVENSPTPVPLLVDGSAPRSTGLTMVRWIYPLPLDEASVPIEGRR